MNYTKALPEDAFGTSFVTSVDCSYAEIVKLFGEPHELGGGDDKVKAEWVFETELGTVTVYDYKEYDTDLEDIRDWHIGAKARAAGDAFAKFVEEQVA